MTVEVIVASLAVLVGFIALAVAIAEMWQNRKHNRLSVRPYLRVDRVIGDNGAGSILLRNSGTGPAIIRTFEVRVNGNAFTNAKGEPDVPAATKQLLGDDMERVDFYRPLPNDAIAAGEILEWPLAYIRDAPNDTEERKSLRRRLWELEFCIDYESVYKESFSMEEQAASS